MTDSALALTQARHAAEPVSFELPWGTLRGVAWGNPCGHPMVALHGWLDNSYSFLPLAAEFLNSPLAQDNHLIALDLAGHGRSDHRPLGNYYPFIDYVYDIWHIAAQQQWSQLSLIGHSMGGYITTLYAALAPEQVQSLVTIEAFGLITEATERTVQQLRASFDSRWQQQFKRQPVYPDWEKAVMARTLAGDLSRELSALLVERGIAQTDDGWRFLADGQLRLRSPLRMTPAQVEEILQHIQCPYTTVVASAGEIEVKQALLQWQNFVPHLKQVDLTGGHHVHMEQPNAIIRAILPMFRSLPN